ncbi:MAG TPA: M18 family aminopeptidase [Bacteroidales bacterium]|nr:M18 family aminopeptidase [Bacteroidales bacterium]
MKQKEKDLAQNLINFIYSSPTPFHAVENLEKIWGYKEFKELKFEDKWHIAPGGKYFVTKNGSAMFGFIAGTGKPQEHGFKIIAAHTDSPVFKIKPSPEWVVAGNYLKLNTEPYGGIIMSTWFDRPLSLAGRISLRSNNTLKPTVKNIRIDRPIAYIPNLAIHMNREVNNGTPINAQTDVLPILGMINSTFEKENYLISLLAKEAGVAQTDILDFELFLFEFEKGSFVGLNEEFISSGKLDNLAMVHASAIALANAEPAKATCVAAFFDNEEVGSQTKQGAAAPVLKTIIERVVLALGGDTDDFYRAVSQSFMISADMAHALHPNYEHKYDPLNRPIMNKGPVIKIHNGQKYTTDGVTGAVFAQLCESKGIPFQKFVNRSDVAGGSTLGNISTSQLDIATVDVGNPMFAMHSIRELSGVTDHLYMKEVFDAFYEL